MKELQQRNCLKRHPDTGGSCNWKFHPCLH
uniref:Uncharacterized protein n=1 Tax=Rhizophora mucronata TaxID=61149 RepID=A0A2P2J7L7_RHIMU